LGFDNQSRNVNIFSLLHSPALAVVNWWRKHDWRRPGAF